MDKPRRYLAVAAVAVALVAGPSVFADEPTPTHGSVKEIRQEFKDKTKAVRDTVKATVKPAIRQEVKEIKKEAKNKIRELKDQAKTDIRALKDDRKITVETVREANQARKEELESKIEAKRAEVETRIKAKQIELKERLKTVKDGRKKEVVQKIDKDIDGLNKRMLEHFSESLDKLSSVLARIAERADKAVELGRDVSTVRFDIEAATTAINTAKDAIVAQSGKTYTIQVTTESELKNAVGRARQALHADLGVVKQAVKNAGEAVRKAAADLGKIAKPATPTE